MLSCGLNRLIFFRTDSGTSCNIVEYGTEETCNGEMFLDCVIEYPQKLSDYAELADFLECRTGKDYSSWLNGRRVYRRWRYQKIMEVRKIKKETMWKSLKCQKIGKSLSLKRQKIGKLLKRWR